MPSETLCNELTGVMIEIAMVAMTVTHTGFCFKQLSKDHTANTYGSEAEEGLCGIGEALCSYGWCSTQRSE